MKVLQIVKTAEGASWAFDQARALSEHGVEIVTVIPDKNGRVAKKYIENNLKVLFEDLSLPITKPWMLFSRIIKLKKIIKQEKPDIIHCHFVTNILMVRIALRHNRIPTVFQVPGPLHMESPIFKKIDIMTSRKNDFWIGACEYTVSLYKQAGVDKNRLFLGYYGGYGGAVCDQYLKENDILHIKYNIPSSAITVGMVSYIYKPKWYAKQKRGIKGHEDFIDALNIAYASNKNLIGIIIGGPWGNSEKYFEKIKNYAANNCLAPIIFTGYRNDIKNIYCELDIVVHPSHSENLGGAAESLAAGRPTISTDVGGFPDIVIPNKTGTLVHKENPSELASAILDMAENLSDANIKAKLGQQLVRKLLDLDLCSERIIDIYRSILKTHD